jgi:hypothetical protein
MYVIKRNGKREPVLFDKITERINILVNKQPPLGIDPVVITQKVVSGVFAGVTTPQLDNLAAETAAYMSTVHPGTDISLVLLLLSLLVLDLFLGFLFRPCFILTTRLRDPGVAPRHLQPAQGDVARLPGCVRQAARVHQPEDQRPGATHLGRDLRHHTEARSPHPGRAGLWQVRAGGRLDDCPFLKFSLLCFVFCFLFLFLFLFFFFFFFFFF